MTLWGVDWYWYLPALLAPAVGALLGSGGGVICQGCTSSRCTDHGD